MAKKPVFETNEAVDKKIWNLQDILVKMQTNSVASYKGSFQGRQKL